MSQITSVSYSVSNTIASPQPTQMQLSHFFNGPITTVVNANAISMADWSMKAIYKPSDFGLELDFEKNFINNIVYTASILGTNGSFSAEDYDIKRLLFKVIIIIKNYK